MPNGKAMSYIENYVDFSKEIMDLLYKKEVVTKYIISTTLTVRVVMKTSPEQTFYHQAYFNTWLFIVFQFFLHPVSDGFWTKWMLHFYIFLNLVPFKYPSILYNIFDIIWDTCQVIVWIEWFPLCCFNNNYFLFLDCGRLFSFIQKKKFLYFEMILYELFLHNSTNALDLWHLQYPHE